MKKIFWVKINNAEKKLVTAALESWADAIYVDKQHIQDVKKYGLIQTISTQWADLNIGKDVEKVRITCTQDEEKVIKYKGSIPVIIENDDWTIIPLENLLAKTTNIIQTVDDSDQGILALQTLERGSDGILLDTDSPSEIKKMGDYIRKHSQEKIPLETVKITKIQQVGMCDRSAIDTGNLLEPGRGMLIGNNSNAFFLVHNENVASKYVASRPFRVNAGAIHAYILLPEEKTKYLCELSAGEEILTINEKWEPMVAILGRNKIEVRPMLEIEAESKDKKKVTLLMQNAETIRLTTPEWKPISITHMKEWQEVLAHFRMWGRHFWEAIEETIQEK